MIGNFNFDFESPPLQSAAPSANGQVLTVNHILCDNEKSSKVHHIHLV